MNMMSVMRKHVGIAACATIALILAVGDVQAQKSSQSDISGVVVSGGDIAGGVYSTIPGQVPSITSPAAIAAVMTSMQALNVAVQNVTAAAAGTTPGPNGGALAMPAALAAVLGCAGTCTTQTAALTAALGGSGSAPAGRVETLTTALHDLAACVSGGNADVPTIAASITATRTAFVRLIENADATYLSNPPAELVAVHKMLGQLITAANSK